MGGGGVAVSAYAYAAGNNAEAHGSCSGQADCSGSHYSAFAADSARADIPATETSWGGHIDATKTAQCSGSGSGGCGVTAVANPFDGDGGQAHCTGNCANFTESHIAPVFTATTPPLPKRVPVGKDGTALDVGELGATASGAKSGTDAWGNILLETTKDGVAQTCDAVCVTALPVGPDGRKTFGGADGPQASWDPSAVVAGDAQFGATDRVAANDPNRHEVYGQTSAAIARDAQGRTAASVGGNGSITDGRSGKRVAISAAPGTVNTLKIVNAHVPFHGEINGSYTYTAPQVVLPPGAKPFGADAPQDHAETVTTHGTWGKITAGTGGTTDNAGFAFNGSGEYKSAWGDKLVLNSGKAGIVVRNAMGYGGHMRIESDGATPADGRITSAEGVTLFCSGCKGDAKEVGYAEHRMPTAAGLGGRNICSAAGGTCEGAGPAVGNTGYLDKQTGSVADFGNGNDKGRFEFVQQLRNDDLSGGWAVAFTSGNGYVKGSDAYQNWIEDSGDGGGTYLGYSEDDFYNAGQSCASARCNGSAALGDRLKWVNPDEKVTLALGYQDPDFVGPPGRGRQDLIARAESVAKYGGAQSHTRWMANSGNKQMEPIAAAVEDALRDDTITNDELRSIDQLMGANPKLMERARRTRDSVETIFKVNDTQPRKTEDVERLLGEDPALYSALTGKAWNPDPAMKDAQIQDAKVLILDKQDVVSGFRRALSTDPTLVAKRGERQQKLDAYNKAVDDYNNGLGGSKADLDRQVAEIDGLTREIDGLERPLLDGMANEQTGLRAYDLAAANIADPNYAANIDLAMRNLDRINGLVEKIPQPDPQNAADVAATHRVLEFAASVESSYDAALVAPRRPENRLNDMYLPTHGPDLALAMRAAQGYDDVLRLRDADSSPLTTQDLLPNGLPDPDKQPRDLTPDELSELAATWIPKNDVTVRAFQTGTLDVGTIARQNGAFGDADDRVAFIAGLAGPAGVREALVGDPKRVATVNQFFSRANVMHGSYRALAEGLDSTQRETLDSFADQVDPISIKGFFKYVSDGSGQLNAHVQREYNREFGYETDDRLRNFGRSSAGLLVGAISSPAKFAGGFGYEMIDSMEAGWVDASKGPSWAVSLVGIDAADSPINGRLIGETAEGFEARTMPFFDTAAGMLEHSEKVLKSAGRWVLNGDDDLAKEFHRDPWGVLTGLAMPVLLVTAPGAAVLKGRGAAYAARANALRTAAGKLDRGGRTLQEFSAERALLRSEAGTLQRKAQTYNRLGRGVGVFVELGKAPFTALSLPVRGMAAAARGTLAATSRLASHGADAAMRRGARRGMEGASSGTRWGNLGERLNGVAATTARGAEFSRVVSRHGLFGASFWGTRETTGAYNTLGAARSATSRDVARTFERASRRLSEAPGGRFTKSGLNDPVRAARHDALLRAHETVVATQAALNAGHLASIAAKAAKAADKAITRGRGAEVRATVAATTRDAALAAARTAEAEATKLAVAASVARARALEAQVEAVAKDSPDAAARAAEATKTADTAQRLAEAAAADVARFRDAARTATGQAYRAAQDAVVSAADAAAAMKAFERARSRSVQGATSAWARSVPAGRLGPELIDRIRAAMALTGYRPVSVGRLAYQLGVTAKEISAAVRNDVFVRRNAPGRDSTDGVELRIEGGQLRPAKAEHATGSRPGGAVHERGGSDQQAPRESDGPAPGSPTDGVQPSSSQAGSGRPTKKGSSGGTPDPRPEDGASAKRPTGKMSRTNGHSFAARQGWKGEFRNRGPPSPTKRALKNAVAAAKQKLEDAFRARSMFLDRLQEEYRRSGAERREQLDRQRRDYDPYVEKARKELYEAQLSRNLFKALRRDGYKKLHDAMQISAKLRYDTPYGELIEQLRAHKQLKDEQYYAVIAEKIRRSTGIELRAVQLAAAMMLDRGVRSWWGKQLRGVIAELGTGEGKTVVGMVTSLKRALQYQAERAMGGAAHGVHVMTHNRQKAIDAWKEYRRVADQLGVDVALVAERSKPIDVRRKAYEADVTIGSARSEFVFDYLDDQVMPADRRVQASRRFALIDEADMILLRVDDYRLARRIAASARRADLKRAREIADDLQSDEFSFSKRKGITISKAQAKRIARRIEHPLTKQQIKDVINARWAAREEFGGTYVTRGAKVEILDNETGRAKSGQRYSDGRHEAIEDRLGLPVGDAQLTIAETTMAKYLNAYRELSGMTGTAGRSRLYRAHFGLGVVQIPSHSRPSLDLRELRVYRSEAGQMAALADQVASRKSHERLQAGRGDLRPELIIFRTPRQTEAFARLLHERGVSAEVLNAFEWRAGREMEVVAAAGRPYQVTVATNMIARGTDIKLGGDPQFHLVMTARRAVLDAGGLRLTVGSTFESPRAVRQAFGRAGRQGEPGSVGQVLSLDDPILRAYGSKRSIRKLEKEAGDVAIPAEKVEKLVRRAVRKAERAQDAHFKAIVTGKRKADRSVVAEAIEQSVDTARREPGAVEDVVVDAAVEQLSGTLTENLSRARQELARAQGKYSRTGNMGPLLSAAAELDRAEAELFEALREYRAATQLERADPMDAIGQQSPGRADPTAADLDAVLMARQQLDWGDTSGAIGILRHRLAEGSTIDALFAANARLEEAEVRPHLVPRADDAATSVEPIDQLGHLDDSAPRDRTDDGTSAGRGEAQFAQIAAHVIDVNPDVVWLARQQADEGDYVGAINTLTRLIRGTQFISGYGEGSAATSEWAFAAAEEAVMVLNRLLALRRATETSSISDGFEQTELRSVMGRLEALVVALHGRPGEAVDAVVGADLRQQLERLSQVSEAPAGAIEDLYFLALRGELTAEQLRALLDVGRWRGQAGPAQAIGDFAAEHGLHWSKPTKQQLRAALRHVPHDPNGQRTEPQPVAQPSDYLQPRQPATLTMSGLRPGERFHLVSTGNGDTIVLRAEESVLGMAPSVFTAVGMSVLDAAVGGTTWYTVTLPDTLPASEVGSVARSGMPSAAPEGGAPQISRPGSDAPKTAPRPTRAAERTLRVGTAALLVGAGGLGGGVAIFGWLAPPVILVGVVLALTTALFVKMLPRYAGARGPPPALLTLTGGVALAALLGWPAAVPVVPAVTGVLLGTVAIDVLMRRVDRDPAPMVTTPAAGPGDVRLLQRVAVVAAALAAVLIAPTAISDAGAMAAASFFGFPRVGGSKDSGSGGVSGRGDEEVPAFELTTEQPFRLKYRIKQVRNTRTGKLWLFRPDSAGQQWIELEHGALELAAASGLPVARSMLGVFEGQKGLFREKLDAESTLAARAVTDLPPAVMVALARAHVVDYALRNPDAHAKNFLDDGRPIDFGMAWRQLKVESRALSVAHWTTMRSDVLYTPLFALVATGIYPAAVVDAMYRASMEQARRTSQVPDELWAGRLRAALDAAPDQVRLSKRQRKQVIAQEVARKNGIVAAFTEFWAQVYRDAGRTPPGRHRGPRGPNGPLAVAPLGLFGAGDSSGLDGGVLLDAVRNSLAFPDVIGVVAGALVVLGLLVAWARAPPVESGTSAVRSALGAALERVTRLFTRVLWLAGGVGSAVLALRGHIGEAVAIGGGGVVGGGGLGRPGESEGRDADPQLAVVAFDEHGMPVAFAHRELAALHALVRGWDEKGMVRARGSQQKVSPTGVWDALGLRYAVANGDAELQRVLVDAGLEGVTVVYLVQQFPAGARGAGPVAHGRVITTSRTEGDLLDRGVTEPARATLEQVVARWADQPAATPERAWEGLDPSGVFMGLAMAKVAAAETLLNALGPIVNGMVAGVGDEAAIGRARAMWERAAAMLASVGVFADSVPAAGRLLETPMDSAQEQLEELRVQLELVHRFAGLSAAASELLLGYPGEFREFREVFEGLEGDRASRREQLGSRGGLDGVLADLAGIRGELEDMRTDFGSEAGALEAIDELVAELDRIERDFRSLHDDEQQTERDDRQNRWGPLAVVGFAGAALVLSAATGSGGVAEAESAGSGPGGIVSSGLNVLAAESAAGGSPGLAGLVVVGAAFVVLAVSHVVRIRGPTLVQELRVWLGARAAQRRFGQLAAGGVTSDSAGSNRLDAGTPGGAVAVTAEGESTPLGMWRDRLVRRFLQSHAPYLEVTSGMASSDVQRVVAELVDLWGDHAFYRAPDLMTVLPDRFVVLYVAPDPQAPGRLAVFVDPVVLEERLPLLPPSQLEKLGRRELARLSGLPEDEVQALEVPPADVMRALVGQSSEALDAAVLPLWVDESLDAADRARSARRFDHMARYLEAAWEYLAVLAGHPGFAVRHGRADVLTRRLLHAIAASRPVTAGRPVGGGIPVAAVRPILDAGEWRSSAWAVAPQLLVGTETGLRVVGSGATTSRAMTHRTSDRLPIFGLASEPVRTGQTVTLVGHDGTQLVINAEVPVEEVGERSFTLRLAHGLLALPVPGAVVLDTGGEAVGMVEHVDPGTGLVTASSAVLGVARQALAAARSRDGRPADVLLDELDEQFEAAERALLTGAVDRAADLAARIEQGLDIVGDELGSRWDTPLEAAEYDAAVARLDQQARRWERLALRAGDERPTGAADLLATVQQHGPGPDSAAVHEIVAAASLLGDPREWRTHLTPFDHRPQEFDGVLQAALRREPSERNPDRASALAEHALLVLLQQLPAEQAGRVARSFLAGLEGETSPALLGPLRVALPRTDAVPDRVRPALRVARHRLARLRSAIERALHDPPDDTAGGLGVLTVEEISLAQRAFARLRDATANARREAGPATRVSGPLAGLAIGEELAIYRREHVADVLAEIGATPAQAARILGLPAFSWLDDDGTAVFAFFRSRLAELVGLDVLHTVLAHERRHVSGGFPDEAAHRDDVEAVLGEIEAARRAVERGTPVDGRHAAGSTRSAAGRDAPASRRSSAAAGTEALTVERGDSVRRGPWSRAAVAVTVVVLWIARALAKRGIIRGPTAWIGASFSRLARIWTALSTRRAEGAVRTTGEGHVTDRSRVFAVRAALARWLVVGAMAVGLLGMVPVPSATAAPVVISGIEAVPQPGDNPSGLAAAWGTSEEALAAANPELWGPGRDRGLLPVGRPVRVPVESRLAREGLYAVQSRRVLPSESWWAIGARLGVDWRPLAAANPHASIEDDVRQILPGAVVTVRLPGVGSGQPRPGDPGEMPPTPPVAPSTEAPQSPSSSPASPSPSGLPPVRGPPFDWSRLVPVAALLAGAAVLGGLVLVRLRWGSAGRGGGRSEAFAGTAAGAPEAWWTDPRVAVLELLQVRAPTRAEIKAWARAVRAEVTGFWLDVIAGLERALDISVPERPLQWTAIYWGTAVRSQIEEWAGRLWHGARSVLRFVATPEGLVYAAVAAGSALATGAMMVWALPAVTSMVAFQVRGSLNTFKQALSQNVRAQRGLLAAVIATLTVNIPHHIRGALTTAAPDANQWISGLFGVAAVTTVLGAIAMLAALINSRDSTVTFPKWWDRFTDRLGTLGAAATLTAIPFMLYAVIVHPDYDGVVTIHPVVFALVVATFTGFGGEALLHLVGKAFKLTLPAKLTRFITVHSAVTIAAYGFLYQLRELLLLVVVTGGSTLAGLLYLVLTRPHLGPVEKIRHAALVTALTSMNTLAATALFLGRPDMPTGSAIMAAVLGVAATVIWIWANRGPPGSDSGGPASPGGSALPGGGSAAAEPAGQRTAVPGAEPAGLRRVLLRIAVLLGLPASFVVGFTLPASAVGSAGGVAAAGSSVAQWLATPVGWTVSIVVATGLIGVVLWRIGAQARAHLVRFAVRTIGVAALGVAAGGMLLAVATLIQVTTGLALLPPSWGLHMTAWGGLLLKGTGGLVAFNVVLWAGRRVAARRADARDQLMATTRWVVLERLAAGLRSDRGRSAVDDLVAAEDQVRDLVASNAPAGVLAAAELARAVAHRVVEELVGGVLIDAARLSVSDRAVARVLRRPVGVAELLLAPARTVWGSAPGSDEAWQELARRRARFSAADAAVAELLSTAVPWLLNPPDDAALPADVMSRIATSLGLPEALVESWSLDEDVVIDVPAAIGTYFGLRIERFGDFDARLGLVRPALDDLTAARSAAEAAVTEAFDAATGGASGVSPASDGSASDLAGRAPLPSLVSLGVRLAVWLAGLLRRVWSGVTRGPPRSGYAGWFAGRYGNGRELRLTTKLYAPTRDRRVEEAEDALAANRAVRDQALADAGGLITVLAAGPGVAGFDELASNNVRARGAVTVRDTALGIYAADVTPAVERAARAGLPLRVIVLISGLGWGRVSDVTRHVDPNPQERTRWVDPLTERWIDFWGRRHPGTEELLTLANGEEVTATQLRQIIEDIDGGRGGYQLVMLVGGRVAGMIGRDRMAVYDLSDGHFHHIGYDDPRNTSIAGFLTRLRDAGHQGVITFHPIPQRGLGLATLGGSFYYAIANVLRLGLLFNQPMLQMWGKFPDVRLLDAVRALPAELRWRAVVGVVGARMDVPGALGYLRTLALLHPDEAIMVGETTIAKEAVTDLLGDQAIHTVNPDWARLVQQLVAAVGLLRQALRDGDLDAARLNGPATELAELITAEVHADPVGRAAGLVDLLVDNIGEIAELLAAAGHPTSSGELHTARQQIESGQLPMYNPYLRELLQASAEVGYLVVLHNDFGLARVAGDGRFADVTPDERFGAPLLALLAEYPDAKIILAHLGVGKFTTMSVGHLELIDEILSNRRFDHVSFDISWNEVTRHLLAVEPDGSTPILDKFIELVRKDDNGGYGIRGRFIFGSDAVKPESNGQYFRQHHDLEPIFQRILDEVGRRAYENVRYRVLETRLADAQRDVRQWVFNELSDPVSREQWDQVLADMWPHRRRAPLEWFDTQRSLGRLTPTAPGTGPDYQLPDNTVLGRSLTRTMHWRNNRQVQSLIRWHNAVTPAVVEGRRLSLRLITSALRASWVDHQNERDDRRAARVARKQAKQFEPDVATHTGGLGLQDAEGTPYTVQAVIAAGQTGRATTPVWARRVLELTQESELRRVEDVTERGRTARRLLVHTAIAVVVFAGVVAVGGWAMWPLLTTTTAAYVQFAIRGALGLHRGAYSQQMRVLVESILERGQFNVFTIRRLIDAIRKYAVFDRATPRQIANFDRVANEFLVIAYVLEKKRLEPSGGETGRIRHETALELFSTFLDKAGNALGAQAQSFHGLNPQGGLLGRLLNTTLALTFVINAFGHVNGVFTLGGFVLVVNAAYAVADLLFLGQAGPSAVTGWAGWDVGGHALVRKLVHRLALPVITVANLLLTLQLAFIDNSAMVIPALALTLSSGYLTILGLISESKNGRLAPRRGAFANAVLNASLMAFGVFTLLPGNAWPLVAAAIGAPVAMVLVSKLDGWLSRRPRAPPADVQQLGELADRLVRVRARLAATPQFRWDAMRIRERNRLLRELDRVEARVAGLRRASAAGPVPGHQLERAGRHVDTVVGGLDALLATTGGGPARLSHQGMPADPRSAIARSPVRGTVSAEALAAFGEGVGLVRDEFVAAGRPVLVVRDGLNRNVAADTGVDDLVVYSDGRLHTDARTWAAMKALARTRPDVVRMLLAHELTHLRHPNWSEEQVQASAPLPQRWPAELRAAVDAAGRPYSLSMLLGEIAEEPGISSVDLARRSPHSSLVMHRKLAWLADEGLVVARRDGRTNVYTVPEGVEELLAGRTARARAASEVLETWLGTDPSLSPSRATRELGEALATARRVPQGLLGERPAARGALTEIHPHSAAAMLDALGARPDGITLDELAGTLGRPYHTVRDRMARMVSPWGLVTPVRPEGPGKNRYVLSPAATELLADLVGLGRITVGPETAHRLAELGRGEITRPGRRACWMSWVTCCVRTWGAVRQRAGGSPEPSGSWTIHASAVARVRGDAQRFAGCVVGRSPISPANRHPAATRPATAPPGPAHTPSRGCTPGTAPSGCRTFCAT